MLWAGSGPATTLSAELERIISESDRLNCSSAADIEAILTRDEEARQRDVAALEDDLRRAATDPQLMEETLMRGRSTKAPLAVVSAMFKRSEKATSDVERRFLRRGVDVLSVAYGVEPMRANWLISSFEIELGPKVGQGGFAVRSAADDGAHEAQKVHQGRWNGSLVAVKVLKETTTALNNELKVRAS